MSFLSYGFPADPVEQAKIAANIDSYPVEDQIYYYHWRMINAQPFSGFYYHWKSKLQEVIKEKY